MTRKTWVLVLALLAAACVAVPAAATDILPAAVGNKWEFETVKLTRAVISVDGHPMAMMNDTSSGTAVYEFTSVDDKKTPPVYSYTETTKTQPTAAGSSEETDTSEITMTSDNDAMKILSIVNSGSEDEDDDKQTYDPPLLYFNKKAKAWDVGTMRDRDVNSPTKASIVGTETVTVPAGTFKDCTKVVYSSDNFTGTMEVMKKTFKMTGGKSRGIYWVADGVGIVKELEVSTSTAESDGPAGKTIKMQAAVCTVSELKPGYTVKK